MLVLAQHVRQLFYQNPGFIYITLQILSQLQNFSSLNLALRSHLHLLSKTLYNEAHDVLDPLYLVRKQPNEVSYNNT